METYQDPMDIVRSIRAMEEHTARTRELIEQNMLPLLQGIYDQVHVTRHAIERLVGFLEGGIDA